MSEMIEGRCSTCEFWRPDQSRKQATRGRCSKLAVLGSHIVAFDDGQFTSRQMNRAEIHWTHRKFGCVEFQKMKDREG
jgi:hypothetical protein